MLRYAGMALFVCFVVLSSFVARRTGAAGADSAISSHAPHLVVGSRITFRHGDSLSGDINHSSSYTQQLNVTKASGRAYTIHEIDRTDNGSRNASNTKLGPDRTVTKAGHDDDDPLYLNRLIFGDDAGIRQGASRHVHVSSGVVGAPSDLRVTFDRISKDGTIDVTIAHDGSESHDDQGKSPGPIKHTVKGVVKAEYRSGILEHWDDERDEVQGPSGHLLRYHYKETIERIASRTPSS